MRKQRRDHPNMQKTLVQPIEEKREPMLSLATGEQIRMLENSPVQSVISLKLVQVEPECFITTTPNLVLGVREVALQRRRLTHARLTQ
jgi:hypothetical protein